MSSHQPLPSISDLRKAFNDGLVGLQDEFADTITGSVYDILGGVGAIVFSQEAQRDQDLFKAGYFDGATGDELTNLVAQRFKNSTDGSPEFERTLDTFGQGTVTLIRPNASGGSGTIWTGTRFIVSRGPFVGPAAYSVSADTIASSTQTSITVPIQATIIGSGQYIQATNLTNVISIDDELFDNSFTVQALLCQDGTDFEKDSDYKARVRAGRLALRKGYYASIIQACLSAGASNVALFPSSYVFRHDYGINVCYVGDANYNGTANTFGFEAATDLTQACQFALEDVRVLGADLFVLPMVRTNLSITATVTLWDDPGSFNLNLLQDTIVGSWLQYFSGNQNAFGFTLSGLSGAAKGTSTEIQNIVFVTPTSDVQVTVVTGGLPNFPAQLNRYVLNPNNVQLTFVGPS